MKKKECPSCAMMISEAASVCPVCHYEFPKQSRTGKWIIILLIALLLLYFLH